MSMPLAAIDASWLALICPVRSITACTSRWPTISAARALVSAIAWFTRSIMAWNCRRDRSACAPANAPMTDITLPAMFRPIPRSAGRPGSALSNRPKGIPALWRRPPPACTPSAAGAHLQRHAQDRERQRIRLPHADLSALLPRWRQHQFDLVGLETRRSAVAFRVLLLASTRWSCRGRL